MNNLRQLTHGWQMFASENGDQLLPNGAAFIPGLPSKWLDESYSFMDWTSNSRATNQAVLVDGSVNLLARYVKGAELFKCPADIFQFIANSGPRARSISLNAVLGGNPDSAQQADPTRTYFPARSLSNLNTPGPANIFTFLDEHPDSIDDVIFHVRVGLLPANANLRNVPASYHDGAGNLAFADGRVQTKRWLDSRTVRPVVFNTDNGVGRNVSVPNSVDYEWLDDRVPYRLK